MKVRPCRFAMTLRISEYFCIGNTAFAVTKIKKSLSQKGACQKLAGRRGGGGGDFQLSNENKASKVSLTSFPW